MHGPTSSICPHTVEFAPPMQAGRERPQPGTEARVIATHRLVSLPETMRNVPRPREGVSESNALAWACCRAREARTRRETAGRRSGTRSSQDSWLPAHSAVAVELGFLCREMGKCGEACAHMGRYRVRGGKDASARQGRAPCALSENYNEYAGKEGGAPGRHAARRPPAAATGGALPTVLPSLTRSRLGAQWCLLARWEPTKEGSCQLAGEC